MGRRRNLLLLTAFIAFTLTLGLLVPYASLSDILLHPWRTLWGSGRQLNATLLEASEGDAVKSASRRLLKPFGVLKVTRDLDVDDKPKR